MESREESETETKTQPEPESRVTALQAALFPPQLTSSGSYFSTFFIKNQFDDEEESRYVIKESTYKEWFSFNKDLDFTLQPPRWPTECQVLEERVQHINNVPTSFEPYYAITGNECQPKPTGDECGLIVYQYIPISAVNYFSRSSTGGSKYLLSTNLCPEEDTLKFESRFESGNLARAIMITPNYYELHLRSDLYTNRHMQWFYFKITNTKRGCLYRFSITNCAKEGSLYNEGMKPLMYSTKDSSLHSIGWRRCGQNITYYCNDNATPEDPDQQVTYTLSFTVKFPHDDDEVYFAHSYPYTYSDLQDYLSELSSHPVKSSFSTVRLLCKSLAGNNVYYVTITSPNVAENKKKRAIVITARVHPGETPSSWVMKGFLDFLTGDSSAAKELRDKFIFKLVPMLNPDGVIVGNNRCSLSAKDLNRQYRTVIRDAYPTIWYTKLMVRRLLEECGVAIYCDLHAHSRRHNIFVYGCESRRGSERKLQEQVFPLMLHKNAADKFSFESCKFRIHKTKEGTGRVVMWMMGIVNSYTMEASFCGSTLGNRVETHFTTQDYEQMGKTFCETLLDYYDEDPRKAQLRTKILDKLAKGGSNADEPTNICLSDYSSDDGDTSTSDEVGKDDDIIVPTVPPPSPLIEIKKPKPKITRKQKGNTAPKSASITRKPLPICKATLKLSLSEKESSTSSSSSSDSEFDDEKSACRRRKKKYPKKKKSNRDYSDNEVQIRKSQRSVSVFDLVPSDMLKSQLFTRRSKTPQPRAIAEKKCSIARQLTEVQAKLTSLKNKLWFGSGNGDGPLSYGKKDGSQSDVTQQRKKPTKKHKKQTKSEKNMETKSKSQQYGMADPPIRLSLQTTISSPLCSEIRKVAIPDTSCDLMKNKLTVASDNNEERRERKKKKKSRKFAKKAKLINSVKVFTRKD